MWFIRSGEFGNKKNATHRWGRLTGQSSCSCLSKAKVVAIIKSRAQSRPGPPLGVVCFVIRKRFRWFKWQHSNSRVTRAGGGWLAGCCGQPQITVDLAFLSTLYPISHATWAIRGKLAYPSLIGSIWILWKTVWQASISHVKGFNWGRKWKGFVIPIPNLGIGIDLLTRRNHWVLKETFSFNPFD